MSSVNLIYVSIRFHKKKPIFDLDCLHQRNVRRQCELTDSAISYSVLANSSLMSVIRRLMAIYQGVAPTRSSLYPFLVDIPE